jgi:hypothetical protein
VLYSTVEATMSILQHEKRRNNYVFKLGLDSKLIVSAFDAKEFIQPCPHGLIERFWILNVVPMPSFHHLEEQVSSSTFVMYVVFSP